MEHILKDLPQAVRTVVSGFYDLPLLPRRELLDLIERHTERLGNAADYRGDIDAGLGQDISRCCAVLLNEQWENEGDKGRRLIQAACLYYVESDDSDGDLQSEFGLNDDAQLLESVARQLGRDDLSIRL